MKITQSVMKGIAAPSRMFPPLHLQFETDCRMQSWSLAQIKIGKFRLVIWTLSKMFFYEDSSTKIRKMLQQRNFITKAFGSIDGETGKDISAYFRLELNEQNFEAQPCFGILFKRIEICFGRNFFLFCNSMLTPTNTIFWSTFGRG